MKLLLPLREMSFAFNPDATLCLFLIYLDTFFVYKRNQ